VKTNLYSQTHHFATPKEAGIFMVVIAALFVIWLLKTVFS
jgi:hypothetical protein